MGGHLKLRRAVIVSEDPLTVELDGERRPAWADAALLGEMREGDEVVVNVEALDLGLGSGGFDVVHVNLTRGLSGGGGGEEHVMKLNYSSLQHAVDPIERPLPSLESSDPGRTAEGDGSASEESPDGASGAASSAPREDAKRKMAVLVLPLHGHLAPAAWAIERGAPQLKAGYVQTGGGALPGSLSRDVRQLRERDLLCGHVTAGPAYGGEYEAISVAGALDAAAGRLGWDIAIAGPGPGIIGSSTRLGHGGLAALDTAHAALALGLPVMLSPRLSATDPRERHRGVSHHTLTVMAMLLGTVEVAVPSGQAVVISQLAQACGWRHRLREATADMEKYATSGLPAKTMGRTLTEDPLFYAAPLAAGAALAGHQ